jgi:hypothetical protein
MPGLGEQHLCRRPPSGVDEPRDTKSKSLVKSRLLARSELALGMGPCSHFPVLACRQRHRDHPARASPS